MEAGCAAGGMAVGRGEGAGMPAGDRTHRGAGLQRRSGAEACRGGDAGNSGRSGHTAGLR